MRFLNNSTSNNGLQILKKMVAERFAQIIRFWTDTN